MAADDPLGALCPTCLVGPGEMCRDLSTGEPRPRPHHLRSMVASLALVQCEVCAGSGWRPKDLETKEERSR